MKETKKDKKVEVEVEMEMPEHEVDAALEDMMRVENHKKNKALMKKLKKKLMDKKEAISSIEDLEALRNEAFTKDKEDSEED